MVDNLLRLAKSNIARSTDGFVSKKIREEIMTDKERENITELNKLIDDFREEFQGKPDNILASPEVIARKVGIARRVYKQTQTWKLFMLIAIEPTDFTLDINKSMVGRGITPNRLSPAKRYVRNNELIVNESDSEFSDDLELDPRETTSVNKNPTVTPPPPVKSPQREVVANIPMSHKSQATEPIMSPPPLPVNDSRKSEMPSPVLESTILPSHAPISQTPIPRAPTSIINLGTIHLSSSPAIANPENQPNVPAISKTRDKNPRKKLKLDSLLIQRLTDGVNAMATTLNEALAESRNEQDTSSDSSGTLAGHDH